MTYENWCTNSPYIIAEAKKHNDWADKAKHNLLTNIGPRIARLGKSGYVGCGFHYDMEQRFGRLIDKLALDWQPCANWCEDVEKDRMSAMFSRIIYNGLLEDVKKAEKSLPKWQKSLRKIGT